MKQRKKGTIFYAIFLILFLLLTIGYAALQNNSKINGTAQISSNTWDIHFDNIVVNTDSVAVGANDTAATIDPQNNQKVDFEVTLSVPGDFYEFTVDVVNAGTLDAMIETITKNLKVDNVVVQELPNYLNFSITYEDGGEVIENQLLAKNTTETLLVRIEFKKDIDELPSAATISTSIETVFIQAGPGAIPLHQVFNLTPGLRFVDFYNYATLGETFPEEIDTYNSLEDTLHLWPSSSLIYIPEMSAKVVVDNNNIVTEVYNEFAITEYVHNYYNDVTIGTYELRGGVDERALPKAQQVIFQKNIETMNLAFGETNCITTSDGGGEFYYCNLEQDGLNFVARAFLNGEIMVGMDGDYPHCYISGYDDINTTVGCYYL